MSNQDENEERDFRDGGGYIGGRWATAAERNTNEPDETADDEGGES